MDFPLNILSLTITGPAFGGWGFGLVLPFMYHVAGIWDHRIRVSPFRLKLFFAYKRNKANWDPFHMCFTISL